MATARSRRWTGTVGGDGTLTTVVRRMTNGTLAGRWDDGGGDGTSGRRRTHGATANGDGTFTNDGRWWERRHEWAAANTRCDGERRRRARGRRMVGHAVGEATTASGTSAGLRGDDGGKRRTASGTFVEQRAKETVVFDDTEVA